MCYICVCCDNIVFYMIVYCDYVLFCYRINEIVLFGNCFNIYIFDLI